MTTLQNTLWFSLPCKDMFIEVLEWMLQWVCRVFFPVSCLNDRLIILPVPILFSARLAAKHCRLKSVLRILCENYHLSHFHWLLQIFNEWCQMSFKHCLIIDILKSKHKQTPIEIFFWQTSFKLHKRKCVFTFHKERYCGS